MEYHNCCFNTKGYKSHPTKGLHYMPISLCNTIYKILARVLVNRWRLIIDHTLNAARLGFVRGKDILDGILMVQELWHSIATSKRIIEQMFMAKLDMEKAYDRLRRTFVEGMLQARGYNQLWVNWIMQCMSIANMLLIKDENQYLCSKPTNGVRQGEPLLSSPLFFITCSRRPLYSNPKIYKSRANQGISNKRNAKKYSSYHVCW